MVYAEWRSTPDARVRKRLLRHNEDDLRALAFIVERLRRHQRTAARKPKR